jgi:hypothetical protein
VKYLRAGVAPVQDVVANTADGGARGTWHADSLEVLNLAGKEKSRMSPFIRYVACRQSRGVEPGRQGEK